MLTQPMRKFLSGTPSQHGINKWFEKRGLKKVAISPFTDPREKITGTLQKAIVNLF